MPASPLPEAPVRRVLVFLAIAVAVICPPGVRAQAPAPKATPAKAPAPPATDLDRFMADALLRRDIDRKTLSDYVLDEVETFEVLGPGRIPFARMRYEFTWYVRDGIHVRSPVKVNGVPMSESERRAYEDRWVKREEAGAGHRAQDEQVVAGHALGGPEVAPDREVHVRQRVDGFPAGRLARQGRRPQGANADGPALPRRLAPPQPVDPRRHLDRAR